MKLKIIIPFLFSLSLITGCSNCCKDCKDSKETPVAMTELPAAVKATLDKETAGGKVTESEKEMKDGKTVYSFDAEVGGKYWDIMIAEDGKLISKTEETKHEKK